MKELKDLTPEQAIEIAKLVYGYPNWIKSDFAVVYQPYDETWFADAREYLRVNFEAIVFGDKIDRIILEIDTELNCWLYYSRDMMYDLPTRNQYHIQKKFMEWNIFPKSLIM